MAAVTVLMSVRNGAEHLRAAVDSILTQTMADLILDVIDDGSDDETLSVLQEYTDDRLRVRHYDESLGLAVRLNEGLLRCTTEFVARMDADDVSHPRRLEAQLSFMKENPEVAVCGTGVRFTGDWHGRYGCPFTTQDDLSAFTYFANPIAHPTVMLRRSILLEHGLSYDENFSVAQDYDLWARLVPVARIANLPEVLLDYRMHADNATTAKSARSAVLVQQVHQRLLAGLGIDCTDEDLRSHARLSARARLSQLSELQSCGDWLQRLDRAAAELPAERAVALRKVVGFFWFELCRNCGNLGTAAWRQYRVGRRAVPGYSITMGRQMIFLLSCLVHQMMGGRSCRR
jgi:glycosyltransferase involved in cell wall biosynthesis